MLEWAWHEGLVTPVELTECAEFVLRDRHAGESTGLLTDQYKERTSKLSAELNRLFEEKGEQRKTLLERFIAESIGSDERATLLQALEPRLREASVYAAVDGRGCAESPHMDAQLALRRQQMNETTKLVRAVAGSAGGANASAARPLDAGAAETSAQATEGLRRAAEEAAKAELEAYTKQIEEQKLERIRMIETQRAEAEEAMKREHADELRRFEQDQQAERAKEKKKHEDALEAKRKQEYEQRLDEHNAELERTDEAEKEKLIKQFHEERERAEREIEVERAKGQKRIAEMKKRRRERVEEKQKLERQKEGGCVAQGADGRAAGLDGGARRRGSHSCQALADGLLALGNHAETQARVGRTAQSDARTAARASYDEAQDRPSSLRALQSDIANKLSPRASSPSKAGRGGGSGAGVAEARPSFSRLGSRPSSRASRN